MTYPDDRDPVPWMPRTEPLGQPAARPYPAQLPPTVPMTGPPVSPPPYYRQTTPMPGPTPPPPHVVVVQPPMRPSSGMATAAMVLGIVGIVSGCCSFGIPSILAVIFGHLGLRDTRNDVKSGRGQAIAGLVLGYLVFVPAVVFSIMIVFGGALGSLTPTPAPTP